MQSMEQHRAEFALTQIQRLKSNHANAVDVQEKLGSYLNALPAQIRMNGLGQALAFCRMKSTPSDQKKISDENKAYAEIYSICNRWLCDATSKGRVFTQEADALTAITHNDMFAYMAAQSETLALLEWLKKFGLAILEKNPK